MLHGVGRRANDVWSTMMTTLSQALLILSLRFSNILSVNAWVPICVTLLYGSRARCENRVAAFPCTSSSVHRHRPLLGRNNHGIMTPALSLDDDTSEVMSFTPILLLVALLLGVAAQTFINEMLKGDQGLGAFLQDGSGYNKSGYKPGKALKESLDDPLPWLKLPQLDFVDVAGQQVNADNSSKVQEQLEEIRKEMNVKLQEGKIEEAVLLRDKLQVLMEENGFEYESDS